MFIAWVIHTSSHKLYEMKPVFFYRVYVQKN